MTENQQNNKAFIFLYPEVDVLDHEITRHAHFLDNGKEKSFISRLKRTKSEARKRLIGDEAVSEMRREFALVYREKLNACIDIRYRQTGFAIFYALLDNSPISPVIELKPTDNVLYVGMDATTHRTKRSDGTYPYPNQDHILDQLGGPATLRVAGFHIWDCVERLARRATERGIDTLVDEDLTELFAQRITLPSFNIRAYPGYNPRKEGRNSFKWFMRPRKSVPWLWQKY